MSAPPVGAASPRFGSWLLLFTGSGSLAVRGSALTTRTIQARDESIIDYSGTDEETD